LGRRVREMIYRVHYYDTYEGSDGYEFFSNKREAEQSLKGWMKEHDTGGMPFIFCGYHTPKTKEEVIEMLNQWASHADNG